jgi:hypothetical protein
LFREIIFEGEQALLLSESLHLASIGVHLREDTGFPLLRGLIIKGVRGFKLGASRLHSCPCSNHLQIDATNREHHQIAGIPA